MITESVEQGHAPMLKLSNIVCYWLVNGCACKFDLKRNISWAPKKTKGKSITYYENLVWH